MWKDLGEGSELVLGIAIALHTLYQFATHYFEQQRQRQALIRTLHAELSYFLSLAGSLAGRTSQAVEALPAHLDAQGFPDPAKEADSMPESALPLAAWLVDRAERLAAYRFSVDVEQIGSISSGSIPRGLPRKEFRLGCSIPRSLLRGCSCAPSMGAILEVEVLP